MKTWGLVLPVRSRNGSTGQSATGVQRLAASLFYSADEDRILHSDF